MKKGMRLKVFAILFCLTSYFGYKNIMLLSDFIETTDYNCEQIAKADNVTLQQGISMLYWLPLKHNQKCHFLGCSRFNITEENCTGEYFMGQCLKADIFKCGMNDYRKICWDIYLNRTLNSYPKLWKRGHTYNPNCFVLNCNRTKRYHHPPISRKFRLEDFRTCTG